MSSWHKKDWMTFGLGGAVGSMIGHDTLTDWFHAASGTPTADEKRNQQKAINDQVKYYKEQTELTRKEINEKRNQINAEKRRVQEKQVRALRRNYSGRGFLGSGESSESGMNAKLGD